MKKLISLIFIAFLFCGDIHATVPVDPGTGLQDNVDYIYLSGVTGLHARFSPLYSVLNGGLDTTNMNMGSSFTWTNNHLFDGTLSLGTGGVVFSDDGDGALTITGAGNGSDENLTLNLDDSSNAGVFTSSTGLNALVFDDIKLLVRGSSAEKFSVSSTTGNTGVVSGAKICPDSVDCSGDTYITESSANNLSFVIGGTEILKANTDVNVKNAAALKVWNDNLVTLMASISPTNGSIIGAPQKVGVYNLELVRATTTNAGDSLKVQCGGASCSATNPGYVVMNGTTAGTLATFRVTSDVTQLLTGATWGIGGTGDITGALIRALFVNDNGTLRTCFAYLGGRDTVLTTDTNATQASVDLPEEVLCNTAVGSSTNTVLDWGYSRANFDDTGGAAEDLWAVQTGVNDVVTGKIADGLWQPWNPTFVGWTTATKADGYNIWTQNRRTITLTVGVNSSASNSTSTTATAPAKASDRSGVSTNLDIGVTRGADNGSELTSLAPVFITGDTTALTFYKTTSSATWTNSGNKYIATSPLTYEVGPIASFIN